MQSMTSNLYLKLTSLTRNTARRHAVMWCDPHKTVGRFRSQGTKRLTQACRNCEGLCRLACQRCLTDEPNKLAVKLVDKTEAKREHRRNACALTHLKDPGRRHHSWAKAGKAKRRRPPAPAGGNGLGGLTHDTRPRA